MADNNRLILIVVMIVGLLAVAAIVISAVAIARSGGPGINIQQGSGSSGGAQTPIVVNTGGSASSDRSSPASAIFLLATGHDFGAHAYFDDEGYLQGFTIQLVDLVCQEAGIDCRVVWARADACWDSRAGQHSTGGVGLFGKWFDACVSWVITTERIHVFDFTQPYLDAPKVYLYVKKGNPFNGRDLAGKAIGFIEGWATDEKCLARQTSVKNRVLPRHKVIYVELVQDGIDRLNNGTIDAFFMFPTEIKPHLDAGTVEQLSGMPMVCMLEGNAVMTRKDSQLPPLWNVGFNKARSNGRFQKLCGDTDKLHGHKGDIASCLRSF